MPESITPYRNEVPFQAGEKEMLVQYVLHLADNALILGHRNSEWTGHGPVLEQDIAISNIALDLIGQARNFYQYAAVLQDSGHTEDSLAYFRDAPAFRNCLLVEQPRGDWAYTIARQFFFSAYQFFFFNQLQQSSDNQLSAIAVKSLKEVNYHLRCSSEWVIRLGDGTMESKQRMEIALHNMVPFTEELLTPAPYEETLKNLHIAVDLPSIRAAFLEKLRSVLGEATLLQPVVAMQSGGKVGNHTAHLERLLFEMQMLQRTYPGCNW